MWACLAPPHRLGSDGSGSETAKPEALAVPTTNCKIIINNIINNIKNNIINNIINNTLIP